MPYSLYDQLKLFSPKRFEELCKQLLKAEDPSVVPVEGKGGDEGIDIFQGPLGTPKSERGDAKLHVWQVKHFPTGLRQSQKQQALKSLRRVIETQDPDSWTLCVPFEFSLDDRRWLDEQREKHTLDITEPLDAPAIMTLLNKPENRSLLDAHFLMAVDQRIDKQVLSLLTDFDLVSERLQPDKLPVKTESAFYDGAVADWKDIYDNLDARREIIGELWDFVLDAEKSSGALIPFAVLTGLSGEGKSTVLRRLAAELVHSGRTEVFWHKQHLNDLSPEQFDHLPAGTLVYIFIDSIMRFGEDSIGGFVQRLRDFAVRPAVITAAIDSQWDSMKLNIGTCAGAREIRLGHMIRADIESLLDKLSEDTGRAAENLGKLAGLSRKEQVRRFARSANRQLLVALIEAKGGEGFKQHVVDELRKLGGDDRLLVRQACIYVSSLHRFDLRMPQCLLQRLLGEDVLLEDQVFAKTHGLIQLISAEEGVITRHPLVAQIIYESEAYKGLEWYQRIINASSKNDRRLIDGLISPMARIDDPSLAVAVADLADRHFESRGALLGRHALRLEVDGFVDRSRAFLRGGTAIHVHDARLWRQWASLERRQGNYGKFEDPEPGTARWLYQRSTQINPGEPLLWEQWAGLECQEGNLGTSGELVEHTARWIYLRGTQSNPRSAALWRQWADLEVRSNNYGTLGDPEKYSVRWVYLNGAEANPRDHALWEDWSSFERLLRSYGAPGVPQKYTARWFCHRRIKASPTDGSHWIEWATLEADAGNHGAPEDPQEYTARWLYVKGTEATPTCIDLWQEWASFEIEQGNLGTPRKPERHSARWVYMMATQANPEEVSLWERWADLEWGCENYGNPDSPGKCSARWIYLSATAANPDSVFLWEKWAELEAVCWNWAELERLRLRAADAAADSEYLISVWQELANTFEELGWTDRVIAYLSRLVQYDPHDYTAHDRLARAYFRAGHCADAKRHCLLALSVRPRDADSLELLRRIEFYWSVEEPDERA